MGFQNIKYGRRYTFLAGHFQLTLCCTSTKALAVSSCGIRQVPSWPCSHYSWNVPPLCYLGQQGLFSAPPLLSCSLRHARARPPQPGHSRPVWSFSQRRLHFSLRFRVRINTRSFICDSLGLSLTSEHGSPCGSTSKDFGMHQAVNW